MWCHSTWCQKVAQSAFTSLRPLPWAEIAAVGLLVALSFVLRKPGESISDTVLKSMSALGNLGDVQ